MSCLANLEIAAAGIEAKIASATKRKADDDRDDAEFVQAERDIAEQCRDRAKLAKLTVSTYKRMDEITERKRQRKLEDEICAAIAAPLAKYCNAPSVEIGKTVLADVGQDVIIFKTD